MYWRTAAVGDPASPQPNAHADQPALPDLVKCDTQGSEAQILRGANSLLARGWRPWGSTCLPVVGAAGMALWARQSTVSMGKKAAEMLKHEVRFSDEEVGEDEIPG